MLKAAICVELLLNRKFAEKKERRFALTTNKSFKTKPLILFL